MARRWQNEGSSWRRRALPKIDRLPPGGLGGPTALHLPESKDTWPVRTWLRCWIPGRPGAPGPSRAHPSGKKGKWISSQRPSGVSQVGTPWRDVAQDRKTHKGGTGINFHTARNSTGRGLPLGRNWRNFCSDCIREWAVCDPAHQGPTGSHP